MPSPSLPSPRATESFPDAIKQHLERLGTLRGAGYLPEPIFKYAVEILAGSELHPRGLELVVRELRDGRTRLLLRQISDHRVCELIDCPA